ncbi:MAG TPA: ATP-binding protein [Oculatellaceae cyanobacterium]
MSAEEPKETIEELERLRQRVAELESLVADGQKSAAEVQRLNESLENQVLQLNVLNAQLKSLTYKLSKARDQAVDASRTKSQFLANMSHEIRTPMNAVIGMSDLLLHSGLTHNQKDFAEIIHDSATSLLDIINDVLDFSKIEAGKLRLELNDFELLPLLEGTTELLAEKARQKQVSLLSFVAPQLAQLFRGDAGRIRQILLNLVGNAVKFTESGEIVVRAVEDHREDNMIFVKFAVTDTGVGIPPESLSHVFEPFVQAEHNIKLPHGGTGLGLSICKHLAEMMGGELLVKSAVGRGSTFSFVVPLEISNNNDKPKGSKTGLEDARILFVGLSKTSSLILETYLESWHASSLTVPTAQEAVKALKTAFTEGNPFLAAIVSSHLNDESAEDFAAEVSRNGSLKETKVVVFNLQGERLLHPAPKSEFAGYLHTPLKQAHLFECLANIQQLRKQNVAAQTASLKNAVETPSAGDSSIENADRSQLILVAEDNAVNQKVALLQLNRLGFRAHAVANGLEVINALQRTNYALIFMDCQMPEMDGYQCASEIRKREIISGKHIPIIAMTAHAMEGDRDKCIAAGMDDYISKPVMPNVLKKALVKWLPESYAPDTASEPGGDALGDSQAQSRASAGDSSAGSDSAAASASGDESAPVNLQRLQDASGGADLRVISRVYFSTADKALKEASEALIYKDFRGLRALARELEVQSTSFSACEMLQLSKELANCANKQNVTEGKIVVEALKLALQTVKTFVAEHSNV